MNAGCLFLHATENSSPGDGVEGWSSGTVPGWQVGCKLPLGSSAGRLEEARGSPGPGRRRSERLTSPLAKLLQQRGGRSGSPQEGAGADVKGSSW